MSAIPLEIIDIIMLVSIISSKAAYPNGDCLGGFTPNKFSPIRAQAVKANRNPNEPKTHMGAEHVIFGFIGINLE